MFPFDWELVKATVLGDLPVSALNGWHVTQLHVLSHAGRAVMHRKAVGRNCMSYCNPYKGHVSSQEIYTNIRKSYWG